MEIKQAVQKRKNPRSVFKGLSRLFSWDDLDFIYFGGYATWNYLVAPFFFLRPGFNFEGIETVKVSSASWFKLKVTLPDDLPTHSQKQIFYFDKTFGILYKKTALTLALFITMY